jgi:hypothetical protein
MCQQYNIMHQLSGQLGVAVVSGLYIIFHLNLNYRNLLLKRRCSCADSLWRPAGWVLTWARMSVAGQAPKSCCISMLTPGCIHDHPTCTVTVCHGGYEMSRSAQFSNLTGCGSARWRWVWSVPELYGYVPPLCRRVGHLSCRRFGKWKPQISMSQQSSCLVAGFQAPSVGQSLTAYWI